MKNPNDAEPDTRHTSPYSTSEKIQRLLWAVVQATLYRYSFRTWYRFRVALLRRFGADVHASCRFHRTVRFECPWNLSAAHNVSVGDGAILYCLGKVTLGSYVTISQHAHVCAGTHDSRTRAMTLIRKPITIGNDVWLAADTFVGPGVTLGDRCVLGARGVALADLPADVIALGNPARAVRARDLTQTPA